jgi:addiction module HigA family antidote
MTMAIRMEDLAGMDFSDVAGAERIGPVTPGDVLREEFMKPLGLSARALARELGVPSNRITAILAGDRGVTAETAIGGTTTMDNSLFSMDMRQSDVPSSLPRCTGRTRPYRPAWHQCRSGQPSNAVQRQHKPVQRKPAQGHVYGRTPCDAPA